MDLYCCGPDQCGNRGGATVTQRDAFFDMHSDLHPGAKETELGADVAEEMIAFLIQRVSGTQPLIRESTDSRLRR